MDIETEEEMPVILSDCFMPGYCVMEPLVSFYLNARAGTRASMYLMGNWDSFTPYAGTNRGKRLTGKKREGEERWFFSLSQLMLGSLGDAHPGGQPAL